MPFGSTEILGNISFSLRKLSNSDKGYPSEGVKKTLKILLKARAEFEKVFDEEIWFIGGVSKVAKGEKKWAEVGDVDIAINGKHMAQDFWKFVLVLLKGGFQSVRDVCEKPAYLDSLWKPCFPCKEHPLALTQDCSKQVGSSLPHENKQFHLNILVSRKIIRRIPMSEKWMCQNWGGIVCSDDKGVRALHETFLDQDGLILKYRADIRFGDMLPYLEQVV